MLITISLIFIFIAHRYEKLVQKSYQVEAFYQFRNIKVAQEVFRLEHKRYAQSFEELKRDANYFLVYEDPHFDYSMSVSSSNYLVSAKGKRHSPVDGVELTFNNQGLMPYKQQE